MRKLVSIFTFLFVAAGAVAGFASSNSIAVLEDGLAYYRQNKLEAARPLLEKAVTADPKNADARAWLAETYRRMGKLREAVDTAEQALAIEPCHSFAHQVLGSAYNPMYGSWEGADRDKAWKHLQKAVTCNPDDGNAWLDIWTEALYRDDEALADKAVTAFVKTGILTPSILAYNRWVLEGLPDNAILITNGDMDTYPAVAVQHVENLRSDVAIVNYSLLNTTWYARYVRDKYDLTLPCDDQTLDHLRPEQREDGRVETVACKIVKGWIDLRKEGRLDNPIAIAGTVADHSFAEGTEEHLCLRGAYCEWLPENESGTCDLEAVRNSLARIDPEDFAGSMVSPEDRSSLRQVSTNSVVSNITRLALQFSRYLIEAGRVVEALEAIDWAEAFESTTAQGPVYSQQIASLREEAKK